MKKPPGKDDHQLNTLREANLFFSICLGFILLLFTPCRAEILTEYGSLRDFLLGHAPGCAYDNFVTHITEGIARADYNIYNPLDPQTTGFGEYEPIPDGVMGDAILNHWKTVFDAMTAGQYAEAESLRTALIPQYPYDIVHLIDSTNSEEFYIVREQLDSSYIDENDPHIIGDEEFGSFEYSWGLYIYSPNAGHPRVKVEVPHPNDDYISPYLAYDIFKTIDAGCFFFSSVGREVYWTEEGNYTNSKSLCDPTRNARHVFQKAHEAFVDYYVDIIQQDQPFTIQVHSYDTRNRNYSSCIISPGPDDRVFNLPLYDWSGVVGGMVDRTPWEVQPAGLIGNEEPVYLTEFYGSNSQPQLVVYDDSSRIHLIPNPHNLFGYPDNNQFHYRLEEIDACSDDEWHFHVEFDELPDCIEDSTEAEFYGGAGFPLTWENYTAIVGYYHPLTFHLTAALDTLELYVDTTPPTDPGDVRTQFIWNDNVRITWTPSSDPFFYTYRIYFDLDSVVNEESPYLDRNSGNAEALCRQYTSTFTLTDLEYDTDYWIAITGVDRDGRESHFSPVLAVHTDNPDRILYPDGGDTLNYLDEDSVRWLGNEIEGAVRIDINRDYPYGEWEVLIDSTDNDGSDPFLVDGPLSDSCRIRVVALQGIFSDASDDDFAIRSSEAYVTLVEAADQRTSVYEWDAGSVECTYNESELFFLRNWADVSSALISTIEVMGPHFSLALNCDLPFTIAPREASECSLLITFYPMANGIIRDTLEIRTTAVNGVEGFIDIPLVGRCYSTPVPPLITIHAEDEGVRLDWSPVSESIFGCTYDGGFYTIWISDTLDGIYDQFDMTDDTTYFYESLPDTIARKYFQVRAVSE